MYHFKKLNDVGTPPNTSGLSLESTKRRKFEANGQFGIYMAQFCGALLHLFGKPNKTSSVAGEAYDYFLEATDNHEKRWLLTAYHGPSGPAIGENVQDHSIYPVAKALLELIESTEPIDFETKIYDDDTDFTITLGCKDSECYAQTQPGEHL